MDKADEQRVSALRDELKRVNDQLSIDRTQSVIQYLALFFVAGVVAAYKAPATFIAVPILWNLWLLYALVEDDNTTKFAVYAQWLEVQIETSIGPTYVFERKLAGRESLSKTLILNAFHIYLFLINLGGWVIGIVLLARQHDVIFAWLAGIACVGTWGVALVSIVYRERRMTVRSAILNA